METAMTIYTSLYTLLGVAPDASLNEIKRAYRNKAKTTHPDKGGDAVAFHELQRAFAVLSDPKTREQYDRTGKAEPEGPNNDLSKLYGHIAGVMTTVLDQATKVGADAGQFDLIEATIEAFEQRLEEAMQKRAMIERTRNKFMEVANRITAKKGKPNTLRLIMEGRVGEGERMMRQIDEQNEIEQKAIDLLKNHEYRFEEPEQMMMFRTTFTV
jgi:curved DNA-binding protein CbpA